ncbi:MAG: hypothetical protein OHK0011_17880 [Turneriella sp.]
MPQLTNAIFIAVKPRIVFDYVTRPDLWHEWHPASTSAKLPRIPLKEGDEFDEIITITYPFVKVQRPTHYTVVLSRRADAFEVKGSSSLFDLTIHYDLEAEDGGARFLRTLTYDVKGPLRFFEPLEVRPRIAQQSGIALRNLKQKLESSV